MRYLLLLIISLTLTACLDDDDQVGVEIQIENRTDVTLENFTLRPGTFEDTPYGNVAPGSITGFRFYERADNCNFGWATIIGTDTIVKAGAICIAPSPIDPGEYRMIFDSIGYFNGDSYLSGRFVPLQ